MLRDVAARRARGEDAWPPPAVVADLQAKARSQGLWNLFLPAGHGDAYAARFGTDGGTGLTNTDYAAVAEQTGRSALAPLVLNCNAPDTGNMEVLLRYGSPEQQQQWLEPLLDGRVRSTFLMTEPGVASSDATNMRGHRHPRRRRGRARRPQVVVDRRRPPRLQGRHLHGAHRPRRPTATASTRWSSCRSRRPACRSSGCSPRSASTTSRSVTARSA